MASARSRSAPSTWRCGMRWRRSRASRCFACSPSVTARSADPRVFVYAAGGYYYPGKDLSMLRGEMRGYLDRGYNVVKMKIGGAPIAEDREPHRGRAEGDRQATRSSRSTPTAASIWRPRSPTPRCCATIRCSGTRKPAIRSTSSFRRRSPNSIPRRWRPAKTCSAIRTRAICCAMAACGRTATGCNSTARCPTGFANTSARSRC